MPRISVIMPCYNPDEQYLKEAIESILNQTYKDFEFLILDDGSTNNIETIINKYKDVQGRVTYIRLKHQGIVKTLNYGFDIAQGEYIARMDSDDISLPDRFRLQVEFLENNPEYSIVGGAVEVFGTENAIWRYPQNPKYFDFLKGCFMAHPAVMLRKEDFKKYNLRYKEGLSCEDYELWSRAIRYLNFYNLPTILLKYRLHGDNLSLKPEIYTASMIVQDNMLDFLTDNEEIKNKIRESINSNNTTKLKYKFIEKIFSLKKQYSANNKVHNVLCIFGIKFKRKVEIVENSDKLPPPPPLLY